MNTYIVQSYEGHTAGSESGKYVWLFYDKEAAEKCAKQCHCAHGGDWYVRTLGTITAEQLVCQTKT